MPARPKPKTHYPTPTILEVEEYLDKVPGVHSYGGTITRHGGSVEVQVVFTDGHTERLTFHHVHPHMIKVTAEWCPVVRAAEVRSAAIADSPDIFWKEVAVNREACKTYLAERALDEGYIFDAELLYKFMMHRLHLVRIRSRVIDTGEILFWLVCEDEDYRFAFEAFAEDSTVWI